MNTSSRGKVVVDVTRLRALCALEAAVDSLFNCHGYFSAESVRHVELTLQKTYKTISGGQVGDAEPLLDFLARQKSQKARKAR